MASRPRRVIIASASCDHRGRQDAVPEGLHGECLRLRTAGASDDRSTARRPSRTLPPRVEVSAGWTMPSCARGRMTVAGLRRSAPGRCESSSGHRSRRQADHGTAGGLNHPMVDAWSRPGTGNLAWQSHPAWQERHRMSRDRPGSRSASTSHAPGGRPMDRPGRPCPTDRESQRSWPARLRGVDRTIMPSGHDHSGPRPAPRSW